MQWKQFWQTITYTHDNMVNLHKIQQLIIIMQMDYSMIVLVKVKTIKIWGDM
jgi:hypothetical protein